MSVIVNDVFPTLVGVPGTMVQYVAPADQDPTAIPRIFMKYQLVVASVLKIGLDICHAVDGAVTVYHPATAGSR